jgi:galactofuranosylgalactofuranosylrhamnosyl-N-acetylglucosaminyl-diphospho-decaprenol beta-1,5/1,6-galactofuranosyltransferase
VTAPLLQHVCLPRPDFAEPELYVRTATGVITEDGLALPSGERATFDTYFGVFSAGRWRRLTVVRDVTVQVFSTGRIRTELIVCKGGREEVVASTESSEALSYSISSSDIESMYVAVTALENAVVHGGAWRSVQPAQRAVRLGVSITTYNRQEYITRTLNTLVALEKSVPEITGNLHVVVADNARNFDIELPAGAPVAIYPNPNLGGAGGFARGLIAFREEGWSTHVLFMDDDIILDGEAIVRAMSFVAMALSEDVCIHGAMVSEGTPYLQFEAGATYDYRQVYPLTAVDRNIDLRDKSFVIEDKPEFAYAYSAWWFTMFPMHLGTENPLPVFVRGDDVGYGLMHTGKYTVMLNGICVWHADFALKNSPTSLYYEVRNFALLDTLVFDKHKWWFLLWRYFGLSFRNLYSQRYASAEYMILGIEHYLAGPDEWMKIDHEKNHELIRQIKEEKAGPLSPELDALGYVEPKPKPIRLVGFVLALLTSGGQWLPQPLKSKKIGVAKIDARAVGLAVRHDTILYRHPDIPEGFVCSRDRERFRDLQKRAFRSAWRLMRDYSKLKKLYRHAYPEMVSDAAWKQRFEG